MNFVNEHEAFIQQHLLKRTGERKGRLQRGHQVAEQLFCQNVWWPFRGNFDHLHPEYEVVDWRNRSYFCDFVWQKHDVKLIIEVKGFHSHVKDMDRQKYCNELNRESFLTSMGYRILSFAYDDVAYRPEICIMLLRMFMSQYETLSSPIVINELKEQEIARLSWTLARPLRPIDVTNHLNISHRSATNILQSMSAEGHFTIIKGESGKYAVRYEAQPSLYQYFS